MICFLLKHFRLRSHETGSIWNRYEIGTDKPCVYTGPGGSILDRFSCPVPNGLTFESELYCSRVLPRPCTAILILVVGSAVLLHDVSASVGDVSMGSPSFLLGEFCCCRSKNRVTVKLRQRSTSVQPMRKKAISFKHVQLRVDT